MSRTIETSLALKLVLLVVCIAAPAAAQEAATAENEPSAQQEKLLQEALAGEGAEGGKVEAPDMGYTATVMLFGAGVLALAGWGVRRFYTGKDQGASSDITVIDTVSLEGGDKLSLVEVDGRRVLVGRSSAGMRSLDAWPTAPGYSTGREGRPSPTNKTDELTAADKAEAVDAFFESAPTDFDQEFQRARQAADSPFEKSGRDGSRERDSVLVSLRALEAKHGGQP
jgi:flagellar biogenesis protein FliO